MADDKTVPVEPDKKSFGLKPNETELIRSEFARHQAALASILSFIAVERLAWPVDQLTAFTLEDDLTKLIVWQQEAPAEVAPIDLAGGDETETAKALKGK